LVLGVPCDHRVNFEKMEKLSKAQQESIKKASTERLRLNLMRADFAEDEVLAMERETLQATWAEVVAKGVVLPVDL